MVDERFLTEFIHKPLPDTPLSEYNIFNVLGVKAKEVVMCRFLTDLLYPEGQHGCGILFLKSFFHDILKPKFPCPLYLGGPGKLYFHSLKNKLLPGSNLSK